MKLPMDVADLLRSRTRLTEERERPVRIAVFVDVEAPDSLVEAAREALRPMTSGARIHVEAAAPGETLIIDPSADAVVALTGPGATLAPSIAASREKFVPTVVLALEQWVEPVSRRLSHPILDTVASLDSSQVVHALGGWLTDRLNGKRLALATNFAFMRRAVSEESIKATAFQNGIVGLVAVIPGADMPIMTANQAKMVLQIAAAYGEPLGVERIKELGVVLGGGFALRAIARQLLTFIPGFGWAVKAGIGYSGTLAMGYAALEHFEGGGEIGALAQTVKAARDRAIATAHERARRGMPAEEPIPAHGYVVTESGSPVADPPADPLALSGDYVLLPAVDPGAVPVGDAGAGTSAPQGAGAQ
jgi:uncharacterized protein (DUF697 family)